MKKNYSLINSLSLFAALALCGAPTLKCLAQDAAPAKKAKLPFVVYADKGSAENHYSPSGWMGNTKAIKMDEGWSKDPHAGKTCCRFEFTGTDDWGGVVWQDPANDWGDKPGGWNLTGAKKLTFWARGENGGEVVSFKFGILGADKQYYDSAGDGLDGVKLTKDWKKYEIDLGGKDLTRIKTGFVWSLAGQGKPVVFYLDDIRYE